VLCDVIITTHM